MLFLGMFALLLVDECLTPKAKTEMAIQVNTPARSQGGVGSRDFQLVTSGGQIFKISSEEFLLLRKGDIITVFYTPWLNDSKYYSPQKKWGYELSRTREASEPRASLLLFYSIAILLSIGILKIGAFEFKVGLAFILLMMSAVKFWLNDIFK